MESSLSLSPRGQCTFHLCLGIELPSLSLGREGSEIMGHFCQGSLSSPAPFPSATSGLQSVNSSPLNFNDSVSPHFTLLSTKYGTPPLECVPRGGKQNFKGWFKYCGFAANHLEYIVIPPYPEGHWFQDTAPQPKSPVAQVSYRKWSSICM